MAGFELSSSASNIAYLLDPLHGQNLRNFVIVLRYLILRRFDQSIEFDCVRNLGNADSE